jgi:hypothetical protein
MAINFVRTRGGSDDSRRFQPMERLIVYLFGTTVLFAPLGMGEAVYRLLFSEFDGATDRLPIEAKNQQSIRVIREEVDRIELALKEILSR